MWNICRTCMAKEVEMIPIFDQDKSPSISDMIKTISSLEFLQNDLLPSQICVTCLVTLETTYNFKEQVIKCNVLQKQTQASKWLAINTQCHTFSSQRVKEEDGADWVAVVSDHEAFIGNVDDPSSICPDLPVQISKDNNIFDPSSEYDVKPLNSELPLTNDSYMPEQRVFVDKNVISQFDETCLKLEEVKVEEHGVQFADNSEIILPKQIKVENKIDDHEFSFEDDLPLTELHVSTDNSFQSEGVQQTSTKNDGGNGESLRRLRNMEELSNTNSYKCSYCSKQFHLKKTLINHTYKHTNRYKCEICEQIFPWPSLLKAHMRKHTGERPFKCQQCNTSFTRYGSLTFHMREIHQRTDAGEKLFKCEQCDRLFTTTSGLYKHLRVHSDTPRPRPHKCEVCSKAFELPSNLNIHMRCHSNERHFKCQLCVASFKHAAHLKRHSALHRKGEDLLNNL